MYCLHDNAGRVDRLGQRLPTFVHRFITKSSIEETIFSCSKQCRAMLQEGFCDVGVVTEAKGQQAETSTSRQTILGMFRSVQRSLKHTESD